MNAGRHEIVARAFRSRLREDRRLELEVSLLRQIFSRRLQQLMTQHQVCLKLEAS